jgi:hypothetical protein
MSYDRRPSSAPPQQLADRHSGGPWQPPPPREASEPRSLKELRDVSGYGPRVQRRAARRRAQIRRRRTVALIILVVLVAAIAALVFRRETQSPSPPSSQASVQPTAGPSGGAVDPAVVPQAGSGKFAYAAGTGKVLGTAGTLRKFQVAVENDTGQNADSFAATVDRILGDSRGWIAIGKSAFQRVPSGASHEFVIYLASPATSEKMCGAGGLHTDKYTSCRLPGQIIINLARWLTGVPDYGAPLDVYQAYAINHEVGHQLGLFHEACPGPGQPAPVMEQQTLGLAGCVANGWPFVDGVRVTGPPVP